MVSVFGMFVAMFDSTSFYLTLPLVYLTLPESLLNLPQSFWTNSLLFSRIQQALHWFFWTQLESSKYVFNTDRPAGNFIADFCLVSPQIKHDQHRDAGFNSQDLMSKLMPLALWPKVSGIRNQLLPSRWDECASIPALESVVDVHHAMSTVMTSKQRHWHESLNHLQFNKAQSGVRKFEVHWSQLLKAP